MAIGGCQFITCRSAVGSSYRAFFHRLAGAGERKEVLMCAAHERLCDEMLRGGRLMQSEEGWVYPLPWMDSLGFLI